MYIIRLGLMKVKYLYKRLLVATTYYIARIRYHLWFYSTWFTQQHLVVYQMGKVGSKTIIKSLNTSKLNMTIYHVHFLSGKGIQWIEELYTKRSNQDFLKLGLSGAKRALPNHVLTSKYLRRQVEKRSSKEKWKIITMVRDPVARNISQFFNWIEVFNPKVYELYGKHALQYEDLIDDFLRNFGEDSVLGAMPLKWFDEELKQVFNIDVFASDFPKSKGYKIYNEEYADVLLLKLENIKYNASSAFKEFLNLDKFVMTNDNTADEKEYYAIYQDFLENLILPESYLDRMYSSKYARHFYTDEEIGVFKAKWSRKR